ncbi:DUF115 domain-containing protein [Marinomonas mediterranea]|jgi:Uncharacterized protein conserved in bacteria|uniref:DUF115 domain-containing protein n=1 Tax=Marinomonas mediterranea (strain ATCC 700492 / JCM 21426 / NBRC 103028 / MMB-1) TaxID=717774 RepID=F2K4C5_MARM1|nr:6-hydroxymethylpterin diphosphokinase MptE-like protein [Marinomonas mediterranea]ADZ92566.1 protein of unknown function DUF115 [Marinomonas mediterranea MMB-1]WCN14560.1 DUF115 domain-containing protein [Marinomonas mediterranea]WCN18609.1 DUF115 domain-containing protein [Marinomonas mediterranea MMB-1]
MKENAFLVEEELLTRLNKGYQRLVENDHVFSGRFSKNLSVIKKFFPDVYDVIEGYEPSEKNVFLESDGALNILFKDTGFTLFSESPFDQIEKKYTSFCSNPLCTTVSLSTDVSDNTRHEYYLSRIHTRIKEVLKTTERKSELPDFAGGVLLFGFDLGYQLVRILDNHHVKHIYIYEENLDLFYYSLFAIDWQWVVDIIEERNSTLHFFLGVDEKQFMNDYVRTLRFNGLYMAAHTYLYMSYSREHIEDVLNEFFNQYVRQIMGWGFFDDGVIGIAQYLSRPKERTRLAVIPDLSIKKQINLANCPLFILGNGPSLDEHIDLIKKHYDDAIIFSCGTTLNTLKKYGIKPDFHVDVERMRHTAEKIEKLGPDYLSGINALTVNVMHPDFYQYFDNSIIGLKPSEPISSIMMLSRIVSVGNRQKLSTMHYSSPIVANLAMSYAELFRFSDVYLIGVDCGFRKLDKHHSKSSGYYNDDGSNSGLFNNNSQLLKRPANFGGQVFTTTLMDTSRVQIELSIVRSKKVNKLFQCYNLSDGVKIEGSTPLREESLLIPDSPSGFKKKVIKHILETFSNAEDASFEGKELLDVVDTFRTISKEFSNILARDFDNEVQIVDAFSEFNSLLMQQYYKGTPFVCELMYGSFVYFANEVVTMIFHNEDDYTDIAKEQIQFFIEFIEEMPSQLENYSNFVDKGNGYLDGLYNF